MEGFWSENKRAVGKIEGRQMGRAGQADGENLIENAVDVLEEHEKWLVKHYGHV